MSELYSTVKKEHKRIGCHRRNLNVEDAYLCKKIKEDTQSINAILENNHQL